MRRRVPPSVPTTAKNGALSKQMDMGAGVEFYFLKVRTADRSRVGQDVPDVADAGEVHHQPLKAQAEARVLAGP